MFTRAGPRKLPSHNLRIETFLRNFDRLSSRRLRPLGFKCQCAFPSDDLQTSMGRSRSEQILTSRRFQFGGLDSRIRFFHSFRGSHNNFERLWCQIDRDVPELCSGWKDNPQYKAGPRGQERPPVVSTIDASWLGFSVHTLGLPTKPFLETFDTRARSIRRPEACQMTTRLIRHGARAGRRLRSQY
jgi:hypothetical protein